MDVKSKKIKFLVMLIVLTVAAMLVLTACAAKPQPDSPDESSYPEYTESPQDFVGRTEAEYFPDREIPGYDDYKDDLINNCDVVDLMEKREHRGYEFNMDDLESIYTLDVLKGNFTGQGEETLVVYMVLLKAEYPAAGGQNPGIYPVFALISDDETVRYYEYELRWLGTADERFEAFAIDKNGKSGIAHISPTNGSGGCNLINCFLFEEDHFKRIPIGKGEFSGNEPGYALSFSGVMGDNGKFTVSNADTGYCETFAHNVTEQFLKEFYDEDGRFVGNDPAVQINPVTSLTWKDIDGDAVPELVVMHNFWMFTHPESLGQGYEAFKYDKKQNRFVTVRCDFIQDTENAPAVTDIW